MGYEPLAFNLDGVIDGTSVWSAGFPGLGDEPAWQLGNGIVSNGKYRNLELTDSAHIDVIQHTAQVDPGSSGGPLLILTENSKTIEKEVFDGKKKKTVTEIIKEKEYKVVGMNTWKAYRRESANFSVMAKDIQKVIDNLGVVSEVNKKETESLKVRVQKYVDAFGKPSSEMLPYISDKMALTMTENQLSAMIKDITPTANSILRNGDAMEGLKVLVADNIKSSVKKPANLMLDNVSVSGDSATATLVYGKTRYNSTWEKTYDGWQLICTDAISEEKVEERLESGFRILNLEGRNNFSLFYSKTPSKFRTSSTSYLENKYKLGLEYYHFAGRFVHLGANASFWKLDEFDVSTSNYQGETIEKIDVIEGGVLNYQATIGVQCPMAIDRIYFAPDFQFQVGMAVGSYFEFTTCVEAVLNVGYIFNKKNILYVGAGVDKRRFLGRAKFKGFVMKTGFIF